jgi:hypothetical protein
MSHKNIYTMNYAALGSGVGTPSSVTSVQSIGKCCPVMACNPSVDGTSGLNIVTYSAVV